MSNPESIEEVLLRGALKYRSGVERSSYLDGACGDDPVLRERVEALLQSHQETKTIPASPERPSPALGDMPDLPEVTVPLTEKPGDKIGRYKLLQKIGEGGFGTVYMAEQQEPVKRRVALKIIKLGMDTRSVVARFEAERQALALMDHPNIAKVLDGGATESGRPYFVMEMVQGVRITEYCDTHKLDTEERLKLFMQVCQAVQHAHQKGIIHRDIKPSNIMVSVREGTPVPKVIDFGIAKAVDRPLTEKTLVTAFEQFIGTPAYVSPEQAEMSGLDIDTRSDIYSLGVLLYELLTGRTPFDARQLMEAGLDELRRRIREEEPPRPSTRLTTLGEKELEEVAKFHRIDPGRLPGLLKGELDWIVMKALEKDRTRRYETANGIALDVERHLNHEEVEAVAPTMRYRLSKFVRRNRLGIAVSGVVGLALLVGAVVSTWQAYQAETARQKAEDSRLAAEQLSSFILDDLINRLQPLGKLDLLETALNQMVQHFQKLPQDETSPDTVFNHSMALEQLGDVKHEQGDSASAQANYLVALEMRKKLANLKDPSGWKWQSGLADIFEKLANTYRGQTTNIVLLKNILVIRRELVAIRPEDLNMQAKLGLTLQKAGDVIGNMDNRQRAVEGERYLRSSVKLFEELTEMEPSNQFWQMSKAKGYFELGQFYAARPIKDHWKVLGQSVVMVRQKAVDYYQKGLHTWTNSGLDSSSVKWKNKLAQIHSSLGDVLMRLPDLDAAEKHLQANYLFRKELQMHEPSNVIWQRSLSLSLYRLGRLQMERSNLLAAADSIKQSWVIMTTLVESNPNDRNWRYTENNSFNRATLIYIDLIMQAWAEDDRRMVQQHWRQLVDLVRQRSHLPGPRISWEVLDRVYSFLGELRGKGGDTEAARNYFLGGLHVMAEAKRRRVAETELSFRLPMCYTPLLQILKRGEVISYETVIPTNSWWAYLDDGNDQGKAWLMPQFSDSTWNSGYAPLGYGDTNFLNTVVQYGEDWSHKPITTYFRIPFGVQTACQSPLLWFELMQDDGVVIHLNGREIVCENMPEGPVDYRTAAWLKIHPPDYQDIQILPPPGLVSETNILAVELHQDQEVSSDICFDLGLRITTNDVPTPEQLLSGIDFPFLRAFLKNEGLPLPEVLP